jgi:hypothetical protein
MFPTSLKGSVCCGGLWVPLRSRASIFVFGVIFDSHPPENSPQLDSIATPKSGIANGLRRVECWVAFLGEMSLPPDSRLSHPPPPTGASCRNKGERACEASPQRRGVGHPRAEEG